MRKKQYFHQAVHLQPWRLFTSRRPPEEFRDWIGALKGDLPLVLEIGIGTGDYLLNRALQEPEQFFLGLEMKDDRIFHAYNKASEQQPKNIAFLQTDAEFLPDFRLPEIAEILTFFSDPWPKEKHADRRLNSQKYLQMYEQLLADDGKLIIKTDHKELFESGQESLEACSWEILLQDEDYKTAPELQTAYERRFVEMGMPIYYLEARPR